MNAAQKGIPEHITDVDAYVKTLDAQIAAARRRLDGLIDLKGAALSAQVEQNKAKEAIERQ